MQANKVILNDEVLIDLTGDDVLEEDVVKGKIFHKADGSIGIGVAELGSGGAPEDSDVVYYDYDGTPLHWYSADEFLALEEEPHLPQHTGLICQGWNWTFEDAKELVTNCGAASVAANYITDDGKTRFYINLNEFALSPRLSFGINGTCTIDWGDGTDADVVTGTNATTTLHITHNYSAVGEYVISLAVSGALVIGGCYQDSRYYAVINNAIGGKSNFMGGDQCQLGLIKVELGENVSFSNYTFYFCMNLETITVPLHIGKLGNSTFYNCYKLKFFAFTPGKTFGSHTQTPFLNCYDMKTVSLTRSCYQMQETFSQCGLKKVIVPYRSWVSFVNCKLLTEIIVEPAIKDSLFINSDFANQSAIKRIKLTGAKGKHVTVSDGAFYGAKYLSEVTFENCDELWLSARGFQDTSLSKFDFSRITSLYDYGHFQNTLFRDIDLTGFRNNTLAQSMFYGCNLLSRVVIPDNVGWIKSNCFAGCFNLREIIFKKTAPPSLENSGVFGSIQASMCVIHVPKGCLEAYTTATNYPDPSVYTYVEDES